MDGKTGTASVILITTNDGSLAANRRETSGSRAADRRNRGGREPPSGQREASKFDLGPAGTARYTPAPSTAIRGRRRTQIVSSVARLGFPASLFPWTNMRRTESQIRRWFFPHRPSKLMLALVLVGLLSGTGCIRRRLTIRSNPPGARVFIDRQEIGVTPVSTAFTYYGTRTIELTKDGYESLTVQQTFSAPWYEITPLDFVSENLVPGEKRDERVVEFQLIPQQMAPAQTIIDRAEQLRAQAGHGQVVVPPGP